MKTKKNITRAIFLFLLVSFQITGCKKDISKEKVVLLTVAPDPIQVSPNPPGSISNPAIIYNIQITEDATNEKYNLDLTEIEGFTYEQGYTYKLKVRKIPIAKPNADGPITSYKLVELISKIKFK